MFYRFRTQINLINWKFEIIENSLTSVRLVKEMLLQTGTEYSNGKFMVLYYMMPINQGKFINDGTLTMVSAWHTFEQKRMVFFV